MTNKLSNLEKTKEILVLLNTHLASISKLKVEQFKDGYLIYLSLTKTILNIKVGDLILVELDNKLNQLTLDFYSNQRTFNSVADFTRFFESIDSSFTDRTSGIVVSYKNENRQCEVEVGYIDTDRQMGQEVIYEIKFYDEETEEEIIAIEVSEYPMGAFNIYDVHPDVEFNTSEVLNYFYHDDQEHSEAD